MADEARKVFVGGRAGPDAEERRTLALAYAEAAVSEVVYDVLQEALRQGVDLPDGFVVATARAVSQRCRADLERLALRVAPVAAAEAAPAPPEVRKVFA